MMQTTMLPTHAEPRMEGSSPRSLQVSPTPPTHLLAAMGPPADAPSNISMLSSMPMDTSSSAAAGGGGGGGGASLTNGRRRWPELPLSSMGMGMGSFGGMGGGMGGMPLVPGLGSLPSSNMSLLQSSMRGALSSGLSGGGGLGGALGGGLS